MKHLRLLPGLIALVTLSLGTASTRGEEPGDQVEVTAVHFRPVTPADGSAESWYEMQIELAARPAPQRSGRVTRRVRIEARLAYDVPGAGGERHWEFYRGSAEVIGFAAGRTAVRFYLPPIIVQRDRLGDAPRYWEVVLSGEGLAPGNPLNRQAPALKDETVRRAFHEKLATIGAGNDGILQPQYLTPFASAYPRATPDFVRRETGP